MQLTLSKPKPGKFCMVCNFMKTDLKNLKDSMIDRCTGHRPVYLPHTDYQPPDTVACRKAIELVNTVSPAFLVNHCFRSHAFGLAMSHKVRRSIDREVYFLGAIMHDLGLTPTYETDETFELSGAKAARAFCVEQNLDSYQSDLVHEMVALHNSVGLAHKLAPEIALIHFGAGADVAGLWIKDIHRKTLEEALERYPSEGFVEGMIKLLEDQIHRKPYSYMTTMIDLGFFKKIRSTRRA